jgi:hypothetical protein
MELSPGLLVKAPPSSDCGFKPASVVAVERFVPPKPGMPGWRNRLFEKLGIALILFSLSKNFYKSGRVSFMREILDSFV